MSGEWVQGVRKPLDRWVQGERSLPRVIDRRYGLLALKWVQRPERATAWGMQRGRAAVPLPRWYCKLKIFLSLYYNTHLAEHGKQDWRC